MSWCDPSVAKAWQEDTRKNPVFLAHSRVIDIFPAAAGAGDQLSTLIDEGISFLREIARIVAVLHGTPNLGNKSDPTDELVYIILARKTRESAYQQTYDVERNLTVDLPSLVPSPLAAALFPSLLREAGRSDCAD